MLVETGDSWIVAYNDESKVEGRKEGMATIIRRMKNAGMSVGDIAKIAGIQKKKSGS